jgi:hypothetical protein
LGVSRFWYLLKRIGGEVRGRRMREYDEEEEG